MRYIPIAALAGLLAGGAAGGCTPAQTSQGATSLCNTAAEGLRVLAAARRAGKLSPEQVGQILEAEGLIDPVCSAPQAPADPANAAYKLATGLASLAAVQTEVAPKAQGAP